MTKKMAPSFEVACGELDRHFARTHRVFSTRQLKAACGGSGSNETYVDYITRWRADRIERSGVLATVLSLQNHINSFTKTTELMLGTLSDQLRMCPIDLADEDPEQPEGPNEDERRSAADVADRDRRSARALDQQPRSDFGDQERAKIERLSGAAAQTSEARFLDQSASSSSEKDHRRDPFVDDVPFEFRRPETTENSNASLSRADMGSRQAALPLGTDKPSEGERETRHDGGED